MALVIGDDLAAALPDLRAQAESMMRDTVKASAPGEGQRWDEALEQYVPVEGAVLYVGQARFRKPGAQDRETVVGGAEWSESDLVLSIPMSAPALPRGSVVECTAVAATSDPALAGQRWTVMGPLSQATFATARRLRISAVS